MNWKIWQYFQYFTEHIYLFLTSEKLGRCREGTRQRVASCRCRTSICAERTLTCQLLHFSHFFLLFVTFLACTSSYEPKKFVAGLPMLLLYRISRQSHRMTLGPLTYSWSEVFPRHFRGSLLRSPGLQR